MSRIPNSLPALPENVRQEIRASLLSIFSAANASRQLQQELRRINKLSETPLSQDVFVRVFREDAGKFGLPVLSSAILSQIRLKPMRSHSGVQTVSVLTKPFPCPGQCIFCPNDIRMPKSYIASEPGAQRAERNSFDPYLQTYSRLLALHNMGHQPSKVEIIILGGTWSYYPESYQIWFVRECFRALNDFSEGIDDRERIQNEIKNTVHTFHRQENRMENISDIDIDGAHLTVTYNQVVSKHYLEPEIRGRGNTSVREENCSWEQLTAEHTRNETSSCRNVGLNIETRPDNISSEEVKRIRRLGCTRTQIGFQSLNDEVLAQNKRGHNVQASRRAVALLRQAGFKIHAHWMPNLFGSSFEQDRQEFLDLWFDPDFMPDELKIYPCALIPSAELMKYYEEGKWKPYSSEQLAELLTFCLTNTPEWVRLTRVIRDIPSQEMALDTIQTNLRQIVEDKLRQQNAEIADIRGREIRNSLPVEPIRLKIQCYQTRVSQEYFLQYVDAKNKVLGFLRLTLPTLPSHIHELGRNAIIRELHVYGDTERVGKRENSQTQHKGYGKQLLEAAECCALENGFSCISVISAVGTREYYRKFGFLDGELYQHKELSYLSTEKSPKNQPPMQSHAKISP